MLLCRARPPAGDDEHGHAVSAQRTADSELWRVAEPRRREDEKVEQAKQAKHMCRGHKILSREVLPTSADALLILLIISLMLIKVNLHLRNC